MFSTTQGFFVGDLLLILVVLIGQWILEDYLVWYQTSHRLFPDLVQLEYH